MIDRFVRYRRAEGNRLSLKSAGATRIEPKDIFPFIAALAEFPYTAESLGILEARIIHQAA